MTLIEAIKSGKRFRRKPGKCPHSSLNDLCDCGEWFQQNNDPTWVYCLNRERILADDWEIEEKKIEITHGQLMQAIERILSRPFEGVSMAIKLAKELGLE